MGQTTTSEFLVLPIVKMQVIFLYLGVLRWEFS